MSDVALRKKKNADAQAAFRARRANYIATLEETGQIAVHLFSPLVLTRNVVTNLESVVLQLQESCREARTEVGELRQENLRLRQDFRQREKWWETIEQARKTGQDIPPPPPFSSIHSHSGGVGGQLGPSHLSTYDNLGYRRNDDPSMCAGPYNAGPSHNYSNPSPSMSYANSDMPNDAAHSMNSRLTTKYNSPYSYGMQHGSREAAWPHGITQSASSGGDSGAPASNHSNSPGFVESPTLTSAEMSYVNRFPAEDQKVPLNNLDTAPYVFPNSRSLSGSPSASTTPPSSSSTSLTSPFQFTFSENSMTHDRPEFDYRRQSNGHGAEVTLHGGTADISLGGPGSDAVRYRLGARRANSVAERPLLPALPPLSAGSDTGSQHEHGSSEGDSGSYSQSRLRPRRGTLPSRSSRSPSPGTPQISGTLAVIKAQAFGALRRTRARPKKSEGAAKVAMEVIEARGLGMNVATGSKRPRLDDVDMQQS